MLSFSRWVRRYFFLAKILKFSQNARFQLGRGHFRFALEVKIFQKGLVIFLWKLSPAGIIRGSEIFLFFWSAALITTMKSTFSWSKRLAIEYPLLIPHRSYEGNIIADILLI